MSARLLRLVPATLPPLERPRDLLEEWRAYMGACGQSPQTVRLHVQTIRGLMTLTGHMDPLDLDEGDAVAFLGRALKPWTRVTYWKAIKAWSRWLIDHGHSDLDLVGRIPRPKVPRPVARPIDDATINRLLSLKLSPRAHAYVRVALFQALRVHEIAKLRAEHFDFDAGWLLVEGKGGVTAPIPIHPEVAKLADWMPEVGYWFPSPGDHTKHVVPIAVSATIRNALLLAGSTATAHQLRDTAATRLQRQVKDIRLTQAMLRHRSLQSTMKYTLAANDDLKRAVGALDWNASVVDGQ